MFCSQDQPSTTSKPVEIAFSWQSYFDGLRGRKAGTEVQELLVPLLPKFQWQNETLDKDMRAFWIAAHRLHKTRPTLFKENILWAADHNLHPKQFVKMCYTLCATRTDKQSAPRK